MVWISLPFDWPPLKSNRRTSNGALLAPTGTAKLTICGACVSSAIGPAVKVAPPLVLYEKLYRSEAVPVAISREAQRHVLKEALRREELNIKIAPVVQTASAQTQRSKVGVHVARSNI